MQLLGDVLRGLAADPDVGESGRVEIRRGAKVFRGTVKDALALADAVGFSMSAPTANVAPGVILRSYCAKGGEEWTHTITLKAGYDA